MNQHIVSCCWCVSVVEYQVKSDVLNCQHSLYDMMSTSLAQKAALWDFYGHRFHTAYWSHIFFFLFENWFCLQLGSA